MATTQTVSQAVPTTVPLTCEERLLSALNQPEQNVFMVVADSSAAERYYMQWAKYLGSNTHTGPRIKIATKQRRTITMVNNTVLRFVTRSWAFNSEVRPWKGMTNVHII